MTSIDTYFSSITFLHITLWFVFVLAGEFSGSVIAHKLKAPLFSKPIWWVIGLMLYSNMWYFMSPLIKFYPLYLIAFIFIFLILFIKPYFKFGLYKHLKDTRNALILSIFFLTPLIIPLKIKISLPPYFADEIGYHYYSPIEVLSPESTERRHNMYFYLPQSLDNLYRITFSIAKSYTVARLMHLSIIFSGLIAIALWLKEKFGNLVYVLWCSFCWYIAANFVSMSTSGLVDLATGAIVLVAVIIMIDDKRKDPPFIFLSVLWGIALSFKYSALIPMLAYGALFVIRNFESIFKQIDKSIKSLVVSCLFFMLFGGFWFIRNFYLTGMFIYGINTSSLFSGWTVPLWPFDLYRVSKEMFVGNYYFSIPLILASIIISSHYRHISKTVLFLLFGWIIELLLVAKLGGFILRYYYHWIYISLILMLSVWTLYERQKIIVTIYMAMLVSLLFVNSTHVVNFVYSNEFTPKHEIDYANGKTKIDDWMRRTLGNQYSLTRWCSDTNDTIKNLYILDPNIMWVTRNGDFQGFLTSCRPIFLDLGYSINVEENVNVNEYVYLASTIGCKQKDQIASLLYEDSNDSNWVELEQYPYAIKQRSLNNDLVCNSEKVLSNLYKIDYSNFYKILDTYKK